MGPWLQLLVATAVFAAIGSASNVDISYKLAHDKTWKPYGSIDIAAPREASFSREFYGGKVVGAIKGDATQMASAIWDEYDPKKSHWLSFRFVDDAVPGAISISGLDLSQVKTEAKLAKALTSAEFSILFSAQNEFESASIYVPWKSLEGYEASRSRMGTVLVLKSLTAAQVIEPKPRVSALKVEDPGIQDPQKPQPQQTSFLRKYWYVFLGGYIVMQFMNKRPPIEEESSTPQQQAPAEQTGGRQTQGQSGQQQAATRRRN